MPRNFESYADLKRHFAERRERNDGLSFFKITPRQAVENYIDARLSDYGYEFRNLSICSTEEQFSYYEKRVIQALKDVYQRFVYMCGLPRDYSEVAIVGMYLTVIWLFRIAKNSYVVGVPNIPLRKMKRMLRAYFEKRREYYGR